MPPKGHAVLSASSSERWLHCPPSARLCENVMDKGSDYAAEGTDAHSLCEHKLKSALGIQSEDPTEDLSWYDAEMEDCASEYASYIMELIAEVKKTCSDPIVLVEQRLDFSKYVPDGFGTGDCLIVGDGTLYVIDFKYGKGVEVYAENNPQMMCYSLGALELFDDIYDIDAVCMTIFQPRRGNISSFTISKDELISWAKTVLEPTAQLAYRGEGDFTCGDWCRFCKVKTVCRARAEANLDLAKFEFKQPPLLTDEDIEDILGQLDELTSWADDIKDYALQAAVSGKKWHGYKLVEGRSNRRYKDESAVADAVTTAGYNPYEKKLLGITAMTSLLGKSKFNEILGELTYKPQGKPTLVPESDKRPAMTNIIEDFEEEI
ncbi:MAG: DUF2800 domain-containing protein [Oscillospiraceae bacterium]|nr:DUF2800 domain-containing protein [Oscillospiraceae bacterium]